MYYPDNYLPQASIHMLAIYFALILCKDYVVFILQTLFADLKDPIQMIYSVLSLRGKLHIGNAPLFLKFKVY